VAGDDALLRQAHEARERQVAVLRGELAAARGALSPVGEQSAAHAREAAAQQERAETAETYARSLEDHVPTLDAEIAELRGRVRTAEAVAAEQRGRAERAEWELARRWPDRIRRALKRRTGR
jgi:septal ring factor EnvC (AmiA/AmiB activator)